MAVTRILLNLYIMQRNGSGRPWFLYYQEAWCVLDARNHRRFQGRMLALYFCSFCCFMWILISFLSSAVFFILSVLVCRSISRSFICCSLSFSILLSLASLSWCASTLLCSRSFSAFYKAIKIKWKKSGSRQILTSDGCFCCRKTAPFRRETNLGQFSIEFQMSDFIVIDTYSYWVKNLVTSPAWF